jgi:peptide/nickel transport system permease protein
VTAIPDETVAASFDVGLTPAPTFARRLLRNPVGAACLAFIGCLVIIAVVAPLTLPHVASQRAGDLLATKMGPSWDHPLGTDTLGRDVLQRLLVGTRVTLIGVGEAIAVVLALGVPTGLAAAFFGSRIDRAITWTGDLILSAPAIVIVIVSLAVFPNSMAAAMATFGVLAAPSLMRIVRAAALPVREELYVAAAKVAGVSDRGIMWRHVMPRVLGPVVVQTALLAAAALLTQAGLAFLGLVVAPPEPSWGGMLADGLGVIVLQPWLIWPPGAATAITILALGLLGDAVRDAATESWAPPLVPTRRRDSPRESHSIDDTSQIHPGALLAVSDLTIEFRAPATVRAVEAVTFEIAAGEVVGIVGESGCGKTVTALSLLGLLPSTATVASGLVVFDGNDLVAHPAILRRIRGKEIGYVSQEPMVSFDPNFRIGAQVAEAVRVHTGQSRRRAHSRAHELLEQVGLSNVASVARRYPHELSGGMLQRASIARALAGAPRLLIADEPTTALDVSVQQGILDLFDDLRRRHRLAILLITHDWGVVADLCDRAIVMYAGQIVEQGDVIRLFERPAHPYTEALLAADPRAVLARERLPTIPGLVPAPGAWPTGCHFHPRCSYATEECRLQPIPLIQVEDAHQARCIHHEAVAWTR